MAQILSGKQYAQQTKQKLIDLGKQWYRQNRYIAILFFGNNVWSIVYTGLKQKFWQDIGLEVRIMWQEKKYDIVDVLSLIDQLNVDTGCIGIIVQLPFPDYLEASKGLILTHIHHSKDIDGLWGEAFGKALVLGKNFMPATPAAVIGLMDYHGLADVKGKIIAILGQSLLVWAPLASILMQKWAEVFSCNEHWDQKLLKEFTKKADIIIACTWVVHLIDESYVRHDQSQVLIDVWYGQIDGKATWDVDVSAVENLVKAYSPVPWWVGPATIAHLFTNITVLQEIRSS